MSPIENKLIGRRTITGPSFINISIRFEDKGGYVKDVVFFEMIGDYGHGSSLTMQLNLFKLRRLSVAMAHAAKNRSTSYKEFTESGGTKNTLALNFTEDKTCWLNLTTSKGGKVGRELGYYDLLALDATINALCTHAEEKLYATQQGKNL